ncbi:triose-phosphate transporter family-domain-containing protein [Mycena haematopus]|nr:triose-phosphate transporter family-domain-containing protein [Mycena haematopus]
MPLHHQRIPIHSVPWSDDEKPMFNDLSSRVRKTVSRYTRYWFPRPNPIATSSLSVPASSLKFVLLCTLWYTSSALSSNTGKTILNQFRYPVTLTFVQFGFVAGYCLLFMSPVVRFSHMRRPTRQIIQSTLPMGMFQVGGHIFSSLAISRIPVSTVHTIKALSPLFTVAAYALLFGVSYSSRTYVSLLPLTVGVMLACSFDMSASNIFFKKIMPSNAQTTSHKLDKLNLLLYSSGMAFLLMIPIWLYYDFRTLFFAIPSAASASAAVAKQPAHSVAYYFFMNGTVHFAQNIIAFVILASTSPVTYSIASLIKRVWVICIAIVWFSQSIHPVQGVGILMTFTGLYMYNNAKSDVERGEKQMRRVEAARDFALPTTKEDARMMSGTESPPPRAETTGTGGVSVPQIYGRPRAPTSPAVPVYPSLSPTQSFSPPTTHLHQHAHPHGYAPPPLMIRVTPPPPPLSPTESYPSPPPSIDEPPLRAHMHFESRRVPAAA